MSNPLDRLDLGLRRLHDAPLSRVGRTISLAVLTLLGFALLLIVGFAEIPPEAPGYMAPMTAALFALLLLGSAALLFRELAKKQASFSLYLLLGLALLGILMMRMAMIDYKTGDYTFYLLPWAEKMRALSFSGALSSQLTEYNVPYQYLIFLISRIPLPELYLYKWFSMAADVLCAFLVMRIAQRIGLRGLMGSTLCYLLVLAWPTFILNSAMWAQCDAIYAGCALAGVYLAIEKKPYLSALAFAFALAFKLQAIFLFPILLVLWGTGRLRLKHLLAAVGFYLLIMVPALLAGMSPMLIITVYTKQMQLYKSLVLSAPTIFQLMQPPGTQARAFFYFGLALAFVAMLTLCGFALKKRTRLTPAVLVDLSLLFTTMIPFLLPRMHERYFYLAELCALAYVAVHPKRFPVALALMLASLNGYLYALQEFTPIPLRAGSLLVLALLCYLCMQLWHDVSKLPDTPPEPEPIT